MSKFEQSTRASIPELDGAIAVAAQHSFRRAAEQLGVSASALSHAVASLEQRLGVKLFHRTTRSVSLTEAGARFVERVRPALGQIADAIEGVNDYRVTPTGTLRINASLPGAERIFEPVVLPFLDRYPDMRVDLVTEGRLVDIVAEGFDAGIRAEEVVPRDMVAVPCSPPIRFVVVGSPDYFERHGRPRTPADLHRHACIRKRMPSGALLPWEFEKGARAISVDVNGALTLDANELAIATALSGRALAWLHEWSVERLIAERRLVTVLDDWSPSSSGLCLYYPPHRHASAGLRAFVAMLRESGVGTAGHVRKAPGKARVRRKTLRRRR